MRVKNCWQYLSWDCHAHCVGL